MSDPYLGEIRMFAGNFAPAHWALCNGQTLLIEQNQRLFSYLGTHFGGDGITTFALPDLQGRVPIHWGQGPGLSNRVIGESGGASTVTLSTAEMAAHKHTPAASNAAGTEASPAGAFWAQSSARDKQYGAGPEEPDVQMAGVLDPEGKGESHGNMAPYLAVSYIIALAGI